MAVSHSFFRSFLQAGFECSSHRHKTGRRLDLLQSTRHDCFAYEDYKRLQRFGIRTVRMGARWHLIEASPAVFDFQSLACVLDAAARTDTEVLLDLLHFGWPDHIDVFADSFPENFARYVRRVAAFVRSHSSCCRMFAPVNEISFLSWAGGDVAAINPYKLDRGAELKRNLARAAIRASDILLNEFSGVRLISPEPVIHIVGNPAIPGDDLEAERYRVAQFQAWDMVSGRLAPELGGRPEYLDILGVNFYDRNEWVHNSTTLRRTDRRYRPFHEIIEEVWQRYGRPIFVSETGTEDDARADWFCYVCDEVSAAHALGVPVHGLCLYPIVNHPGWEDDRHCYNGLFDYADAFGNREIHAPLARAIFRKLPNLQRSYQSLHDPEQHRPDLSFASPVGIRFPASSAPDEPVHAYAEGLLS